MRSVSVDPETLKQFEDELEAAEAELERVIARATAPLMPRIENLRLVVQGMRGLNAERSEPVTKPSLTLTTPAQLRGTAHATSSASAVLTTSRATYGGRPSIPAVISDVLDPADMDLDLIYEHVCAHSAYADGKKPSRGSVTNRLNDMAKRGEIIKVNRRTYKSLPPDGGAENPDERGLPTPAIQLDVEKPPSEEMVLPRSGHPH